MRVPMIDVSSNPKSDRVQLPLARSGNSSRSCCKYEIDDLVDLAPLAACDGKLG